jgi:hypothetical protein
LFEALVAGTIGAVAAGLAWAVARRSGPTGTRRHRTALFAAFVVFFTLGSATLMPHARAWKQEREAEDLLRAEPLFVAVLEDDPSLREPLRAALLAALRGGQRGEALLVGQRLLSPRLWRYVPRASDAAAVRLGRALVATLKDLQARDPEQCYRFLFPAVSGPPRSGSSAREDQILGALRVVVASAHGGAAEPLDRSAAAKQLAAAFGRLRERHGADIDALKAAQAPGADHALVCRMTIALYSELATLPSGTAGQALRHALGPANPPDPDAR